MMRKIMLVCLALTITLFILSGCSTKNETAAGGGDGVPAVESVTQTPEDNAGSASQPPISVKAPEGWSEMQTAALAQYMNGMASFIVTCDTVPADVNGSDAYVSFAQDQYIKAFPDASFAETKTITVDGVEGRDYSFTYSASDMKMRTRVVYLLKGSQAYTLTCGALDDEFDKVAKDFQSMIESFKMP